MKTKEQIQERIDKINKILDIQVKIFNCEPFSELMYEKITVHEQCELIKEKNILQWVLESESKPQFANLIQPSTPLCGDEDA